MFPVTGLAVHPCLPPASHPSAPPAPLGQLGEDKPFLEILPDVIKSYGMSLMYGEPRLARARAPARLHTCWAAKCAWWGSGWLAPHVRRERSPLPGLGLSVAGQMRVVDRGVPHV